MEFYPHPTLPNVVITSPGFIGPRQGQETFLKCSHDWPKGLPQESDMKREGDNLVAMQACPLCGGVRGIIIKDEK